MRLIAALFLCLASRAALADIVVRDDTGQEVRMPAPARRVVALAPHIAENLFAAGAGDRVVAAVDYSDYPEAARKLPRVGGYSRIDLEALAAAKPDLVIAWQSGNPPGQIEKLKQLGLRVFISQPNRIDDIAKDLDRYGLLVGSDAAAQAAAQRFRNRLAGLRQINASKSKVRVFYEVWKSPLTTVGGPQIISDAIRICGGENIFGQVDQMAPVVSVESVLLANPEVVVASGMGDARPEWLDEWRKWTRLAAVQRDNLFHIAPDIIQRHTPRILDGVEKLCADLDQARQRRPR